MQWSIGILYIPISRFYQHIMEKKILHRKHKPHDININTVNGNCYAQFPFQRCILISITNTICKTCTPHPTHHHTLVSLFPQYISMLPFNSDKIDGYNYWNWEWVAFGDIHASDKLNFLVLMILQENPVNYSHTDTASQVHPQLYCWLFMVSVCHESQMLVQNFYTSTISS